jgi:predicted nucleic acid-binding Zn ribbon protein
MDWWIGRFAHPGSARARCHACYLAYEREVYRKRMARQGRVVIPRDPNRPRVAQRWKKKSDETDFVRHCVVCGEKFVRGNRQTALRVCSSACHRITESAKNRRKHAKRKGARIGERYTLADVVARDGRRCHLCRKMVDVALPGTDRMGPTVDHLVPIADGGLDELANVRLAHRSCNCARGRGGDVQLLLFG